MDNSKQTKIDYSALDQPVTAVDIAAYKKWRGIGTKKDTALVILCIVLLVFAFVSITLVTAQIQGKQTPQFSLVILTIIIAATIYTWVVYSRKRTIKLARLYKFAVSNNAQLLIDYGDPRGQIRKGLIFNEGRSRSIKEAIVFNDGTEIGNYAYTTGSGRNQHIHLWTYARIKLTRQLPNMVLDNKSNNLFGFTNLPDSFRGQRLSLEGDFDKHFTLFVPKGYERDALYVFTPDVMAALIDAGQAYDMEVIDDELVMYNNMAIELDDKNRLMAILAVLDKIGDEIRDQSKRYADERVGDRAANVVAEPGRRLKQGLTFGSIATFAIIAFYLVLIMIEHMS